MKKDYVFPQGNEEYFVQRAGELGISELVFLYRSLSDVPKKGIESIGKDDKEKCSIGIFLPFSKKVTKDIQKVQQKGFEVVVDVSLIAKNSRDEYGLRTLIEQSKNISILGVEYGKGGDFMHFRNSGLNHILVDIAQKRKISFLFSFQQFLSTSISYQSVLLGRFSQNKKLCDKGKVSCSINSFAGDVFKMHKHFTELERIV